MAIYNAASAIEKNFLAAKWSAELARMDEAQNKLDFYKDDSEDIIKAKLREQFHPDNYERLFFHTNTSLNLLKRVVNEISTIYKEDPQRIVENDRYHEIIAHAGLNTKMKKVNRYTNFLNDVIIKVGINGKNRIDYSIITPNVTMVMQNEDDPTIADAIIYMTASVNTQGSLGIYYHYWDVWGTYCIYDKNFRVYDLIYDAVDPNARYGVLPYKDSETGRFVMPLVVNHKSEPEGEFWDQTSSGDLFNAAIMLGAKMTLFDYHYKVGTFKQLVAIGEDIKIPSKQVSDPLTLLMGSGKDAKIDILDMQINLKQMQEAIVFQINSVINNYGISADAWTLSVAEMSGVALKIRNRALIELREEQIPYYRKFENDLFNVTRIVNNAHFTQQIPESLDFNIDFAEITFPEDPMEKLKYQTFLAQGLLISPGQFYQAFNPDVNDKDASKAIIENGEAWEKLKQDNPDLGAYIDKIMGAIGPGQGEPGIEEEEIA